MSEGQAEPGSGYTVTRLDDAQTSLRAAVAYLSRWSRTWPHHQLVAAWECSGWA